MAGALGRKSGRYKPSSTIRTVPSPQRDDAPQAHIPQAKKGNKNSWRMLVCQLFGNPTLYLVSCGD